jgi:hypothetical protein
MVAVVGLFFAVCSFCAGGAAAGVHFLTRALLKIAPMEQNQ